MGVSYFLKVTHGGEVKEYPLDQALISIGRSIDNLIVLDDAQSSRRHAEVEWAEGRPRITDLGSSNGTVVNGVKIKPNVPYALKAGDIISVGSYVLTVRALPVVEKTDTRATAGAPPAPYVPAGIRTVTPAKKASLFQGKSLVFIIAGVLIIVAILAALFLTQSGMHDTIIEESMICLIDKHKQVINDIDPEIDRTEQDLFVVGEKLLLLDNVVEPCLDWIEIQKKDVVQEQKRTSWQYTLDQDELDRLKNDQYRVTKLELEVLHVGMPEEEYHQTIEVADVSASGAKGRDWMDIKTELKKQQATLEEKRDVQLEKRNEAISTIKELAGYWVASDVEKINSTTFVVSGEGLGWSDGFSEGKWTFYRDRNDIIPANNNSEALMTLVVPEP